MCNTEHHNTQQMSRTNARFIEKLNKPVVVTSANARSLSLSSLKTNNYDIHTIHPKQMRIYMKNFSEGSDIFGLNCKYPQPPLYALSRTL